MADLKLLQAGASDLGVELNRDQLSAFSTYMSEMLKWNQRSNLTSITASDEIQTKHFLDSLTCLLGFPGFRPSVVGRWPRRSRRRGPGSLEGGRAALVHRHRDRGRLSGSASEDLRSIHVSHPGGLDRKEDGLPEQPGPDP